MAIELTIHLTDGTSITKLATTTQNADHLAGSVRHCDDFGRATYVEPGTREPRRGFPGSRQISADMRWTISKGGSKTGTTVR